MCKCFFPFCQMFLHSLIVSLLYRSFCVWCSPIYLVLLLLPMLWGSFPRTCLLRQCLCMFPLFYFNIFIVLGLKLVGSHCMLNWSYVYGKNYVYNIILLHVDGWVDGCMDGQNDWLIDFYQHYLLQRLSWLHCVT